MIKKNLGAFLLCLVLTASLSADDAVPVVTTAGEKILLDGGEIKLIGLRCSNALLSDQTTDDLIKHLDLYQRYGLNSLSVFVMGSRFGDIKGYLPDSGLNPTYSERLERVLRATEKRQMVTIVGCLYWGTSAAKEDLSKWTQEDANRAVANTARWLGEKGFKHVILDPDNEGMACRANKWKIEPLIAAAKAANPPLLVANNTKRKSTSEDINMHFAPKKAGKPWLDSESTPAKESVPGNGYWGNFSRQTHNKDNTFYNYSRIGRYTAEMKKKQFETTDDFITNHSGLLFASTWLQCPPTESIGGPFAAPGGRSQFGSADQENAAWDQDIKTLLPDSGILWWLEYVQNKHAKTKPTTEAEADTKTKTARFEEKDGVLVIEAEHFHRKIAKVPTNGTQKLQHAWTLEKTAKDYSGTGYMANLPDEQKESADAHNSPKDGSGAELVYHIKVNTAGRYHVWVRGRSLGGESNGVHVQLNGKFVMKSAGTNMSGFRPKKQWIWENGHKKISRKPILELTEGLHTLHVYGRDDGFRIDKILLGIGQDSAPKGAGPDESPRVAAD